MHKTATDPTICVLIPVYNEEPVIAETIKALIQADVARTDIYIVDDKSTDNTAKIASATGVNVYTVPENGGKANAQRKGLDYFQLANRYDWIIFLDGDTKVHPHFYNALFQKAVESPDVALFVGQVQSVKNNHIYSASRAYDYTYGQDIAKQGQSNFNTIFVSPGCASMYKASVLRHLDIDHLTLAEDMDLTMQVHRRKGKVVYVPEALVFTQDPSTFKDYHKQVLRWYRGFWQVVKKHKVVGFTKKQGVDLYMILLMIDALIFNRVAWLVIAAFLFPSVIIYGVGIDLVISSIIALYVAYRSKRLDVITKFPVYYWLSYVNFYAYARAFVEIVLMRKTILAWNKVKRYDFDSHTQNLT